MDNLDAVEDLLSQVMGVDKNKEIFNLWYEVIFLRNMLNTLLENNPDIGSCISQFTIDTARAKAQGEVNMKFPNVTIDFINPVEVNSPKIPREEK